MGTMSGSGGGGGGKKRQRSQLEHNKSTHVEKGGAGQLIKKKKGVSAAVKLGKNNLDHELGKKGGITKKHLQEGHPFFGDRRGRKTCKTARLKKNKKVGTAKTSRGGTTLTVATDDSLGNMSEV